MRVKDLRHNPENPRKITDAKLAQLAKSMREFGDLSGIVFNVRTGNVVGGTQRTKNLDESASVVITEKRKKPSRTGTTAEGYVEQDGERFAYREVDWDRPREMAANIAANKGAGEWDTPQLTAWMKELSGFDVDFDMELTMFDTSELKVYGIEPEIEVEAHTRSPVTGVDEDEMPEKPPSHKDRAFNAYWDPWLQHAKSLGQPLFGWYVWDKGHGFPGHHNGRLGPAHEFVFHFNQKATQANKWIETNGSSLARGPKGMRFRQKDGSKKEINNPETLGQPFKIPDSVIRITREMARGEHTRNHPAVFPVAFPEFLMLTWHGEGSLVYEPFAGSGTTIIAAEKTKRRCYAMEIDPAYCDVIVSRWEAYTGEKAKLLNKVVTRRPVKQE